MSIRKILAPALILAQMLPLLVLAGCGDTDASGGPAKAGGPQPGALYSAAIEIAGENRYKAIRLTPQIYNAAQADLSDILIKSGNGEAVPYFINYGYREVFASREYNPLVLIDSYVKDDDFYFDYKLAAPASGDMIATSIEFTCGNSGFAKNVGVYGSYDNRYWTFIQDDTLYIVDDSSKMAIEFSQPQKYTHYRLTLGNNLEKIAFSSVRLVYDVETVSASYFIDNINPPFNVESKDKKTEISVEGLKNLRLCDVTIHSGSMFKRTARAPGGAAKEIYNLTFNDTSYSDTAIPLDWPAFGREPYIVTISDGDDKPIGINGISVRYYADEVIFEGKPGEAYTLEFGPEPSGGAPVYDIARYKNEILKGDIDKASIGEIKSAPPAPPPAPALDYKLIFNIVVIAIAFLLGYVLMLRLRKKSPAD